MSGAVEVLTGIFSDWIFAVLVSLERGPEALYLGMVSGNSAEFVTIDRKTIDRK